MAATQATVSRDLDDLGAIKVRAGDGESIYAIPELPKDQRAPDDHLRRALRRLGRRGRRRRATSSSCAPRRAPRTSSARRSTGPALPEVLGTVAGDDTLIIVVAEGLAGADVADQLRELAGL